MEFKKLILILTIAVSAIIISLLGVSYAWYSLSNSSTKFNTTTSDLNLDILYAQSEFISLTTGIPINENDAATKAGISRFTVSPNSELSGYKVLMSVEISGINIDEELKTEDFKIQLYENGVIIYDGSGEEISGTSLVMKNLSNINVGSTYNYELRIWIKDTGLSQNQLMGKKFSGKIKISSSIKK